MKEKKYSVLISLLLLSYVCFFLWRFFEGTHNTPHGDDYTALNFLAGHTQTSFIQNLKDAFVQYYEQRVVFARLFMVYSYKVFGHIYLKEFMFYGNILFFAAFLWVLYAVFSKEKNKIIPLSIITILLFNVWLFHNLLWFFSMLQYQNSIIFTVIAIYFSTINKNIYIALLASLVATLSVGTGNFVVVVVLFIQLFDFRKKFFLQYLIGGLGVMTLFYWKYEFLNGFYNSSPSSYLLGFFAFCGGRWSYDLGQGSLLAAEIIGFSIVAVAFFVFIKMLLGLKKSNKIDAEINKPQIFAFGVFVNMALIGLAAAINRILYDEITNALYTRYQLFVTVLLISFFCLCYFSFIKNRQIVISIFVPICLFFGYKLLFSKQNDFKNYQKDVACYNFSLDTKTNAINTLSTCWLQIDTATFISEKALFSSSFSTNLIQAIQKPQPKGSYKITMKSRGHNVPDKQCYEHSKFKLTNVNFNHAANFDGLYLLLTSDKEIKMIPLFSIFDSIQSYEESIGYYQDAEYNVSLLYVENGQMKIEKSDYTIKKAGDKMTLNAMLVQ